MLGRVFERLRRPSPAYWPMAISVLALCITFLIAAGFMPVREALLNWNGGHLLLGKGRSEDWKNLVAELVRQSDVPLTQDVGLFLHINHRINVDGQTARNIAEICAAVIYAQSSGGTTLSDCHDADFSRTKLAILELQQFGFIDQVQFFNAPYRSYELNALGNRAFEKIRVEGVAAGKIADKVALLDFDRPGLRAPVLRARTSYAEALKSDIGARQ